MRLADHVDPKRLKEANLLLLLEGAKQVGGGAELRKRTKARAKMVSDAKLQELLDEIPEVSPKDARRAWSHWMAVVTVRQPFFDANHRTALIAFNAATTKVWGFEYSLAAADVEAMMLGSRKLVKQAHRPADDAPRMATVAALQNPNHPARQFYAGFEGKLREIARKT
jgi:hypothetical protein